MHDVNLLPDTRADAVIVPAHNFIRASHFCRYEDLTCLLHDRLNFFSVVA
jgi:hypothetical protein